MWMFCAALSCCKSGFLDQKTDVAVRLERKVIKLTPAEQDAVQCWPIHKDEGSLQKFGNSDCHTGMYTKHANMSANLSVQIQPHLRTKMMMLNLRLPCELQARSHGL